ncbi:MAG: response regulator [Chloroflexi bacterium]|nr:response regulator [Chloroflexota bacterium]
MKHLKENLLVQFSLASFLIIGMLAITLSVVITTQLDHNVEHLREHGAAMMAGAMIKDTDPFSIPSLSAEVRTLQLKTLGIIGVSFFVLYGGLVSIVWRGWGTIVKQRRELEATNATLEERVRELKDANEQLLAETRERQQLQEQLQQSQKMEAIGQLAGGVAHDLNNMLTPIMGYAQMEMAKLPSGDSSSNSLEQIHKAAERAADLTRQLLAFSRRQVVEPKVIDLNDLIIDLDQMLRRLLGQDIELVTLPSGNLDLVEADPGQIEQVIMNLAINARDAMPNGGKLTIETANITLDEPDALQRSEASSGPHVMLSVTDTGRGMTKEVQSRIFEPFFTTKEEGKGTGLGLATCFGIAKQSGGHIEVQSELGQGTTFKLYIPSTESAIEVREESSESETLSVSLGGTETVLLAEDEPLVRKLVAEVLRDQGYQVMEAATGQEALEIFQSQEPGSIQMLFTDVVMPQMGGIELAQRVMDIQPNTKVLFASGYTQEPLFLTVDPSQEIRFIQKPFLPDALALKVREVLDWEPARAEV